MYDCSNNTPLDIFGLYREVIKCGGLVRNERYDESNRWCGNINFAGSIFPNMRNYTPNHKATSIGNQLLSNYKKFLYEYEKCYAPRDLQGMTLDEVRISLGDMPHTNHRPVMPSSVTAPVIMGREGLMMAI